MPSATELFALILFSSIGFAAFVYGKKSMRVGPMVLGVVLMIYPYFISELWQIYVLGCILCGALYFWRD